MDAEQLGYQVGIILMSIAIVWVLFKTLSIFIRLALIAAIIFIVVYFFGPLDQAVRSWF